MSVGKFSPLKFTCNPPADVVLWIEKKNVVALKTEKACRVFHSISFDQSKTMPSFEDMRVIYVDCNPLPGLLNEGRWDLYIRGKVKGVKELGCEDPLGEAVISQSLSSKEYVTLDSHGLWLGK